MTNPQRKSALSRVREPHPAETAAAVARVEPAPPAPTAPAAPPPTTTPDREGTTQLNVRVRVSLKARAERGTLALGMRAGHRVTLAEVVEAALDSYLGQQDL